jgi:hypothetical protein
MKISKQTLEALVNEAVAKKMATIKESSDYTAKRQIIHSAQQASMEFENEIASLLNLVTPDELPGHLQREHLEIAETMKGEIVKAVADAVTKFAHLPRKETGNGKSE